MAAVTHWCQCISLRTSGDVLVMSKEASWCGQRQSKVNSHLQRQVDECNEVWIIWKSASGHATSWTGANFATATRWHLNRFYRDQIVQKLFLIKLAWENGGPFLFPIEFNTEWTTVFTSLCITGIYISFHAEFKIKNTNYPGSMVWSSIRMHNCLGTLRIRCCIEFHNGIKIEYQKKEKKPKSYAQGISFCRSGNLQ